MAEIPTTEELKLLLAAQRQQITEDIEKLLTASPTTTRKWLTNHDLKQLYGLNYGIQIAKNVEMELLEL